MSFQASNCIFKPLSREDFKYSLAWHNTPEIRNAVFGYRFPVTKKMEENWYEQVLEDGNQVRFAIRDLNDKITIGFVMLTSIDQISRNAELGILIGDENYRGKGISKEAIAFIEEYARNTLNLIKVIAKIASFNTSSLSLFASCNYIEEGVLKLHYFVEGEYHNVHILSKIF